MLVAQLQLHTQGVSAATPAWPYEKLSGRSKGIYSYARKMQQRGDKVSEVHSEIIFLETSWLCVFVHGGGLVCELPELTRHNKVTASASRKQVL